MAVGCFGGGGGGAMEMVEVACRGGQKAGSETFEVAIYNFRS